MTDPCPSTDTRPDGIRQHHVLEDREITEYPGEADQQQPVRSDREDSQVPEAFNPSLESRASHPLADRLT